MNQQETLALFAKGREAWNAWAAEMQAQREALEAAETWSLGDDRSDWNDATAEWQDAAAADFREHTFQGVRVKGL